MGRFEWHATAENDCAGILLHYFLSPFIGQVIDDAKHYMDYQHILDAVTTGKVALQHTTEVHVTHHLMLCAMIASHFEEAQTLFEACYNRLGSLLPLDVDLETSLLEERAMLLRRWSTRLEEQGDVKGAKSLREEGIAVYRRCCDLIANSQESSSLQRNCLMKRLSAFLNCLGYQLNRNGQFEEALQAIEQSIALQEQGYVQFGGLAAAYGEKSQTLVELGRFQEALLFDEKAMAEAQRCADTGHTYSQEEVWIYAVNRGRLYLRIGKVDEAECLLLESCPKIHARRSIYRMLAKEALEEIRQWRQKVNTIQHQLDWRWVERYREIDAYDAYWWWSQAGPFTQEEQQQWERLYTPNADEVTKELLGRLITQSLQRELTAALAQQREPHIHYPALAIQAVRAHVAALLTLDEQIQQQEPNAIVRRLYHGAIEDEVCYLRIIEATYEGHNTHFWEFTRRLYPEPTVDEMNHALLNVRRVLLQGLSHPETAHLSRQIQQMMTERFHLELDLSCSQTEMQALQQALTPSTAQPQKTLTAQAAKRFFEAILHESGYEGWQVIIDAQADVCRVESALRQLFVPDEPISLADLKHLLAHELAGHVARSFAGEHSPLGLLGINTKNYDAVEEGLALYHERRGARLHGDVLDDTGVWFGTLATGIASGVLGLPQTFLSLFHFFEPFILLLRLLDQPSLAIQVGQRQARSSAFSRCLRTYRGVPDLEQAGICFTRDVVYLRGLLIIERAVAEDETILDRLAVGKISLEHLADLEELGISVPPQPLRKLAYAPELDAYITSFERENEREKELT
jgi:tetratricopeptide (TPR) repeat protein